MLSLCSEENVWKLCEQVNKQHPNELSKCYAVYVSNERRTVPLWRQKAGRGEDKLVVWVSILFFFSFSMEWDKFFWSRWCSWILILKNCSLLSDLCGKLFRCLLVESLKWGRIRWEMGLESRNQLQWTFTLF